ncbi:MULTISPECIES: hypothetical protein [Bradyrhizobium]|uniref:hypothetical protein n=1 Tax=Bradyrhizobium centrosematis TaxID=1300039 RepID=UPI00216797F4|nr:hypothetical protein [Bradyrhizobium centrosematis]MCS3764839.1 hypothetical protein [Bradyrhizobium centrosematis]MCS3776111.1 hypothetical protein [Bradyrhizobium centrosematis]
MAEVLYVYREVQILKKAANRSKKSDKPVAIVSYDEKPGILPQRQRRICHQCRAGMRPSRAIMSSRP